MPDKNKKKLRNEQPIQEFEHAIFLHPAFRSFLFDGD